MISLAILILSHETEINHLHLAILNSEVVRLNILVKHFPMFVESLNSIEHLKQDVFNSDMIILPMIISLYIFLYT